MNIRCMFGHKWYYYINERVIKFDIVIDNKKVELKITDELRMCERCYKKQKAFKSLLSDYTEGWIEESLTKDEIREQKIRSLGI